MSAGSNYSKKLKKRKKKNIITGIAHIRSTFNNTIITITDMQGNAIVSSSGGMAGFKNSRESTPHAAKLAAEQAADKAAEHGLKFLLVHMKGPGMGKDSAVSAFRNKGLVVTAIRELSGIAHNGCRARKKRRV
ncbi:30S ribosomal protein S11 [Rickettsiales bacterium LUAb2]